MARNEASSASVQRAKPATPSGTRPRSHQKKSHQVATEPAFTKTRGKALRLWRSRRRQQHGVLQGGAAGQRPTTARRGLPPATTVGTSREDGEATPSPEPSAGGSANAPLDADDAPSGPPSAGTGPRVHTHARLRGGLSVNRPPRPSVPFPLSHLIGSLSICPKIGGPRRGTQGKPHRSRTGGLREPGHGRGYRLSSQDGVDRAGRDPHHCLSPAYKNQPFTTSWIRYIKCTFKSTMLL